MQEIVNDILVSGTRSNLQGSVERVTYFNAESGQCVLEIKPDSEDQVILVAGKAPWAFPGLHVEALLESEQNEKQPFHALQFNFSAPTNNKNLKRFLRSEALSGIGPKLAQVLARAFPQNLFSILDQSPEKI